MKFTGFDGENHPIFGMNIHDLISIRNEQVSNQKTNLEMSSAAILYPLQCFYLLTCGEQIDMVQHGKYHGCWCSGSLRRQDIITHGVDHVE